MMAGNRPDGEDTWHWCTPAPGDRTKEPEDRMLLHGRAIDHCAGLRDGSLFISVGGEYAARVWYCPFCGCKERRV